MTVKNPKYLKSVYAWYYRNHYRDYLITIVFDTYKPSLFEILYTTGGMRGVYLGNNKLLEIGRDRYRDSINPNIKRYGIIPSPGA